MSAPDFDRTRLIQDLGDIYGDMAVRPPDVPQPPVERTLEWGLRAAAIALVIALVCFIAAQRGLDAFDRHEELVKGVSESSFMQLGFKTIHIASNALFVVSILSFLFAVAVPFPWVRKQIDRLLDDAFKKIAEGGEKSGRDSKSPPALFFPQLSNRGFAMRTAIAASAALVTIGAFSIAIPGRDIKLGVDDRQHGGSALLHVGTYDIKVPGKPIDIDPSKVRVVDEGSVNVSVPQIAIKLPPVTTSVDSTAIAAFSRELRRYREFLAGEKIKEVKIEAMEAANRGLQEKLDDLGKELSKRPTKTEFALLRTDVEKQTSAAALLNGAINNLTAAVQLEHRGPALGAISLARDINAENGRVWTTLFHQSRVEENCNAYRQLRAEFPDILKEDACRQRGRLETLKFWSQPEAKPIFAEKKPDQPAAIIVTNGGKCAPEKIAGNE